MISGLKKTAFPRTKAARGCLARHTRVPMPTPEGPARVFAPQVARAGGRAGGRGATGRTGRAGGPGQGGPRRAKAGEDTGEQGYRKRLRGRTRHEHATVLTLRLAARLRIAGPLRLQSNAKNLVRNVLHTSGFVIRRAAGQRCEHSVPILAQPAQRMLALLCS